MKKHSETILIIFLSFVTLFCFTECASKKRGITSSEKYRDEKIERLFVIINLPEEIKYATKLETQLRERLAERNIVCDVYKKEKLDLTSDNDLSKMIQNQSASHVMTIYTQTAYTTGGGVYEATYKLVLQNVNTGDIVWDASLNHRKKIIGNQAKNDVRLILTDLEHKQLIK